MRGVTTDRTATEVGVRMTGWLLLGLLCVLLLAASSPSAAAQVDAENDTEAPEWGNATTASGGLDQINVTFYDNGNINRDSITADDFDVSDGEVTEIGSISDVDTGDNRTGVVVNLRLGSSLTADSVTVSFQETGSVVPEPNDPDDGSAGIADDAGNALTSGSAEVSFSGDDTAPPEWGNATSEGPTEINLTFYDNRRIDTTSIAASNFSLSSGSVESISDVTSFIDGNRSGVYLSLYLEDRVDEENLTVSISDNGSIVDTAGNELRSDSVVATGMDGLVPDDEEFDVTAVNATTVEIRLETNEPLSGIRLPVSGPVEDELSRANFTERVGETAMYTAQYTAPEEGSYTFTWERATDRSGNTLRLSESQGFEYIDDTPDVVLDGPYSATQNTPVNFSAANSEDEDGIASVQWRIDGGTILSGETIQVAFATIGSHEVVVEVTDANGTTAVASRQVRVPQAPGTDTAVNLTRHNGTHASGEVDGSGYVQQVRAANGSIVGSPNVSLERVNAVFPDGEGVALTLSVTDEVPGSLDAPGLGLFEIDHGGVAADQVSIRFGVNRSALNGTGLATDEVALYRNNDGWTELDTTVVSRESDRVVFQSPSPGLSQFAVGASSGANRSTGGSDSTTDDGNGTSESEDPPDTTSENSSQSEPEGVPDIVVTNVTVNETAPGVNDTVSINVTAENRGTQAGNYSVPVRLNNSTLATEQLTVQPGDTRTERYVHELPERGPLEVDGQRVANVSTGGGLLPGPLEGLLSGLPNPLALWPGGIVGTVLGAVVGLGVVVYGVLKALAIHLGY